MSKQKLELTLPHQKRQRELEGKRSKLRRELFTRQDEVEAQRNDLISRLVLSNLESNNAVLIHQAERELP